MKNSNNKKMSPKKVTKVQKQAALSKNLGSLKKRGKEDTKKSPLLRGAKKTSTSEKGMKKSVSSDRAFNYNYIRTKTFDLENYISTIDEGGFISSIISISIIIIIIINSIIIVISINSINSIIIISIIPLHHFESKLCRFV